MAIEGPGAGWIRTTIDSAIICAHTSAQCARCFTRQPTPWAFFYRGLCGFIGPDEFLDSYDVKDPTVGSSHEYLRGQG